MNIPLTSADVTDYRTTDRQLINGLQQTLHANYEKLLKSARSEWESKFAGDDPSDACVTVRITAGAAPRGLPCAGVLEQPKTGLLNGSRWGVPA